MNWIVTSLVYCLLDITQALMSVLVGIYQSIKIDIGYDSSDTSPDTPFSYTFLSSDATPKGTFDTIFPQTHLFMPVFTYMAYVLVLFIFVFSLYKMMLSSEPRPGETPGKIIGRFFLSLFCITWSYAIFVYFEKIAQVVYEQMNEVYLKVSDGANDSFIQNMSNMGLTDQFIKVDGVFDFLLAHTGVMATVIPLLSIGFFFTMIWNYCKLLLEVIERYILLAVMFYTCPLAFASIISDSSKGIFRSWMQMLLSQFLLMIMNLFFVGIFTAGLSTVYTKGDEGYVFSSVGAFVFENFLLIVLLIVAQKFDQHLNSLGFSVAQAGSGMAGALITTGVAAAKAASLGVKTIKGAGTLGGAVKDTMKTRKAQGAVGAAGEPLSGLGKDGKPIITPVGSVANAAKVESLAGRDPGTGQLTKDGVKEAMANGATLTGEDAKRAAEAMGLPQAKGEASSNIDWNNSQINRDGATLMSKTEPGTLDSHIGFGSDWTAKDEAGNSLAQMAVPTETGFENGSRVMTDKDLGRANAQVLDQLTSGKGEIPAAEWKTPSGNSVLGPDGNYTDEALASSYFVGTNKDEPSRQYVAGLQNVNTFDLQKGGQLDTKETVAHGDLPKFSYGVQTLEPGQTPGVQSTMPVLMTAQPSSNTMSDMMLKKKEYPISESMAQAEPQPSLLSEIAHNYRERKRRRR